MTIKKCTNIFVLLATFQTGIAFGFGIQARSHGQPIHETITEKAALESGLLRPDQKEEMKYLIEGARFNDDPEGYLIEGTKASEYSLLKFGLEFKSSKKHDPKDPTKASHFGSYQFLHAMGTADATPELIRRKIILYASRCWKIASDSNSFENFKKEYAIVSAQLKNPVEGFKYSPEQILVKEAIELFPEEVLFFHAKNQMQFQYRALGSLLHIIQDSYAKGHTVRVGWETDNAGKILYFQNYSEQDSGEHSKHDNVKKGDIVLENIVARIPGSGAAYQRTKQILEMYKNQCPWTTVAEGSRQGCTQGVYRVFDRDIFDFANEVGEPTKSHPALVPQKNEYNNNY